MSKRLEKLNVEHDMDLAEGKLGSSTGMGFTLDDDGYCKVVKKFNTIGTNVNVTANVNKPAGWVFDLEIKTDAGDDISKSDKVAGNDITFKIHTGVPTTKLTIKFWSHAGSEDAGAQGHVNVSY